MKQSVVRCGKENHLIGILSEPKIRAAKHTAFLIWNTGVGSRVGHFRGHYELASALAGAGYSLLRFDLAGRGDSQARSETISEQERNTLDVMEVMNYLEMQHGFCKFVLLGVCSGAVDLHHAALLDHRVAGFVMVDTYIHPTLWFKWHYYWQRINLKRMWLAVRRRYRQFLRVELIPKEGFFGIYPSVDDIRAAWRSFMRRDLATMVIFTGGFNYIYSYRDQFQDMLDGVELNDRFRLHVLKDSDHVFSVLEARREFHHLLLDWVAANLPDIEAAAVREARGELPADLQDLPQNDWERSFLLRLLHASQFNAEQLACILASYRQTASLALGSPNDFVSTKPVPKLGRDRQGNPAWFLAPRLEGQPWQLVAEPHKATDLTLASQTPCLGRDEYGNPAWFVQSENSGVWYRVADQ